MAKDKLHLVIFQDQIIAASYHKKFLRSYMNRIRKVKEDDYEIRPLQFDCGVYDEYMLEEYYGVLIPVIDSNIIEYECVHYDTFLSEFMSLFKTLGKYTSGFDELSDLSKRITNDIEYYAKSLTSNRVRKRLEPRFHLMHPIMHCGMNEYLKMRKIYQEERMMDRTYRDRIYGE